MQVTEGGFERVSGVTEVEQVSYVGSPYLPRCIRTQWGKEMTSNKHRSSESARGANTIKDDLSEAITLRCHLPFTAYKSRCRALVFRLTRPRAATCKYTSRNGFRSVQTKSCR
jgi:hypothetical protein